MSYKIKAIMYLVIAVLVACGGGNKSDMAVGNQRTGGAVGLADDLTIGKAGNTILGRKDTKTEFRSATAKFHPIPLASQISSPALAASTNLAATIYSWAKTWGGNSSGTQANNIIVDGSGNLYVAGEYTGTVDFNPEGRELHHTWNGGLADAFLSKFASDGTFQWAKTWGGTGRDVSNGIAVDSLGNVYVSGPFQNTVDFNPSGGTSHTSNAGSMNNIFLSKFAPDGTFQWVKTWGPSDGGAESYSIAMDGSNNVYVVGDFSGSHCDFNPWGLAA